MFGMDVHTLRKVWTVFSICAGRLAVVSDGPNAGGFHTCRFFLRIYWGPIAEDRGENAPPGAGPLEIFRWQSCFLLLVIVIATVLVPVASQVGQQAAALASRLPGALQSDPLANLQLPVWLEPMRERVTGMLRGSLSNLDATLIPLLKDAGANAASVLGGVLALVLIPILSFFFLQDSEGIHNALVDLLPAENRETADEILHDLHSLLVHYIRSLVVLACLVLLIYTTFLYTTGAQYAVLPCDAGCTARNHSVCGTAAWRWADHAGGDAHRISAHVRIIHVPSWIPLSTGLCDQPEVDEFRRRDPSVVSPVWRAGGENRSRAFQACSSPCR